MKKAQIKNNFYERHNRKSIRLKGYDYSQAGLYFITIVTQDRKELFGKINNHKIELNNAGEMIKKIWFSIPIYFTNIKLHKHVIMPNHIHGIIEIFNPVGADSISAQLDSISAQLDSISAQSIKRAEMDSAPTSLSNIVQMDSAPTSLSNIVQMDSAPTSLSNIVQMFKRYTTIEYIKMVKNNILPAFNKRIWQRNYWEHIIRNEKSYNEISEYIINNPLNWNNDKLNTYLSKLGESTND